MRLARFLVLLSITVLLSWPVFADTISIGLQENGPITTEAFAPGQSQFTGAFGTFSSITVAGHGQSTLTVPDLLFADNIATATATGGTLMVWVTDQGMTSPLGTLAFTSSFTANAVPAGWTVAESTFVSATNALFSGTPLSVATFSAIGTSVETVTGETGTGPYSVTEEFVITAPGAGDANNTIDLSAVEVAEPPLVMVVGLGLIGVGFLLWRRVHFWAP